MLTLLARWQGADARLWSYSVTHRSLTIRLEITGKEGYLDIYVGDTQRISAPTSWSNACFNLHKEGKDSFGEELVLLTDSIAHVEIVGGVVEVIEKRK